MMDGGWGGGMGPGGWTLMIIFWIALIALIGVAIARLFPSAQPGPPSAEPPTQTPRQLLDERLARGDIDVETYERLRKVLSGPREGG